MIENNLHNLIQDIKLIVTDVDGVLTDGKILIDSNGIESKFFNVEDGTGSALARYADLPIALISGRYSKSTEIRSKELNIKHCFQGCLNKVEKINELLKIYSLDYHEVAYIGDSLVDIPVMKIIGFPITVPNSHPLNKKHALYVSKKRGGDGVLFEVVEKILMVQDRYDDVMKKMKKDVFES